MGKVTVKHYLNDKLKPIVFHKNQYGKNSIHRFYPLYIYAIKNGKTFRFKSKIFESRWGYEGIDSKFELIHGFESVDHSTKGYFTKEGFKFLSSKNNEFNKLLKLDLEITHWSLDELEKYDVLLSDLYASVTKPVFEDHLKGKFALFKKAMERIDDFGWVSSQFDLQEQNLSNVYNFFDAICRDASGGETPFWNKLKKQTYHLKLFMDILNDYINKNGYLTVYEWNHCGHKNKLEKHFISKIEDKNLQDKCLGMIR